MMLDRKTRACNHTTMHHNYNLISCPDTSRRSDNRLILIAGDVGWTFGITIFQNN